MSIIKQTIYQSRKNKEKELEIKLYNLKNLLVDFEACDYFGVYKSDDCDDEFLVYEEWKSEEDYVASQDSEAYKSFQKTYDELVLKKHNLPVF
ncbi:antibiotic biosynthesis monooxygenase family protein [Arcobacter sp. F2176]|uniref:antibiotic biosynthesis monooxygenase family protein n=1 Tax=unclassified Arcobacter TaxID=2593671 RepID=UPI0013E9691C|nr:antibiotic biosynthesis monooxygenase family protein [Arcobacter sp. F2176]